MQATDAKVRNRRFAILSQAPSDDFSKHWSRLEVDPEFELLRGPETGLVSLRGRIGGGGAPFTFGDATATRASVKLKDGRIGHAMLLGRDSKRTAIAAVIDALCQNRKDEQAIERILIEPLADAIRLRDEKRSAQTTATRVDFFTMVRGED